MKRPLPAAEEVREALLAVKAESEAKVAAATAAAAAGTANSDADFEVLRARVAALRLVQRRLQAEATVLTGELASVDGVGSVTNPNRTQLTNRSSLGHLADDLDRSIATEEAEAGDGGWERAAALMARLDAMANELEEQKQQTR